MISEDKMNKICEDFLESNNKHKINEDDLQSFIDNFNNEADIIEAFGNIFDNLASNETIDFFNMIPDNSIFKKYKIKFAKDIVNCYGTLRRDSDTSQSIDEIKLYLKDNKK